MKGKDYMAKYKVDDWVLVRGLPSDNKFHVVEIVTWECSGGEQVSYKGRHYFPTRAAPAGAQAPARGTIVCAGLESTFREIELGELAEPPL